MLQFESTASSSEMSVSPCAVMTAYNRKGRVIEKVKKYVNLVIVSEGVGLFYKILFWRVIGT